MWLICVLFLSFTGVSWGSPECHWNGVYRDSGCQCYEGFSGPHCAIDCHCVGHGVCQADGTCQCETGWKWEGSVQRCVWDCRHCDAGVYCTGPGECGCALACKWGQCRNGKCQCYEGYKGDDCSHYDQNIMQNKGVPVGINIADISYFSSELKFVDAAKQSQEWITQREGRHDWDTHEHQAVAWRADGYPSRLDKGLKVAKLMFRDFGAHVQSGNYTVLYEGEGDISFSITQSHVLHNGKGRLVVNFPAIGSGGVLLSVSATNPSDPLRHLRVLPPGYENTHLRLPFHPLFLRFLARFSEVRFMDYLHTNGHMPEPTTWASRRPADFHTQEGPSGGSVEHLVELANAVGSNPWVCMPHAADDDYVRQFASYVKQHLRPDLTVYVEYSNEVWNGIFRQTAYTKEQGKTLYPSDPSHLQGMKYFNKRATEVANIWTQVWGSSAERVTNVYAWQTGYHDFYRQALQDLGDRTTSFHALAITGYFDCDQAAGKNHASELPGMSMGQIQNLCNSDLQAQKDSYAHYMDVAKAHGLKLVMYEGGPSVMENGAIVSGAHVQAVTDKAIAFNRDPAIQKPVTDVLVAWNDIVTTNGSNAYPGGLFNYYSSTGTPKSTGSWGMTEYTGQDLATVPKWRAVQTHVTQLRPHNPLGPKCSWVEDPTTGTLYGCYPPGVGPHSYVCIKTADRHTWTPLPSLHVSTSEHVTLDGYDVTSKKLYIRVTSSEGADSYYVFSEHSQGWAKMQNFDYYSEAIAPAVLPRYPQGSSALTLDHIRARWCYTPHP